MTIAFIPPKSSDASLHYVRQVTQAALEPRHELRLCPPEYRVASKTRRREILRDWLAGCDILMGCPDTDVLQVRRELDRCIPWAMFMLGRMSRGAPTMNMRSRYLDTRDVLVCTCTADAVLCTKFFPNATVAMVPFAVDETLFSEADPTLRTATRASLGIGPDEPVLLYAGRLSLEKNVHTLLKTFRVVLSALPAARLVIAGAEANRPFGELGTFCLGMERMLKRFCAEVGLDSERVLFLGQQTAKDLHLVYGAADVLVNLTLNHDENFGYAQVEAMACGVPVVGSTWGGLKDTVIDGATGVRVPTIVTAAGVKVDWWAAANAVVRLFQSGEVQRLRQRCCDIARERYSIAAYRSALERVVCECTARAADPGGPLVVSAFAEEYWAACSREIDDRPPYRRGAEAFRLYRELIAPYASEPASDAPHGHAHGWVLAAPLHMESDGRILVNDPICPVEMAVPRHLAAAVGILSSRFADRPVLPARAFSEASPDMLAALAWMHEAGLVLRTGLGILNPDCVPPVLGRPVFDIRHIDHRADIVWLS
jgi:glycosyltransferase involved in cell wall biosynthesis